jgi:hypothetical protein
MNKIVRVKVLRPFLLKTQRQEAGAEVDMDSRLAAELVSYNKVEVVKAAPVVEPPPEVKPERAKKGV